MKRDKNYRNFLGIKEGKMPGDPETKNTITGIEPKGKSAPSMAMHQSLQNEVRGWGSSKGERVPSTVNDPVMSKIMDQLSFKTPTKKEADGRISENKMSPLDLLNSTDDDLQEDSEGFLDEDGDTSTANTEPKDKDGGEGKKNSEGDVQIAPATKDDEKREKDLSGSEGGEGMKETTELEEQWDQYLSEQDELSTDVLLFEDVIKEEEEKELAHAEVVKEEEKENDEDAKVNKKEEEAAEKKEEEGDGDGEGEEKMKKHVKKAAPAGEETGIYDSYEAKILKHLVAEMKSIDEEMKEEDDERLKSLDEEDMDLSEYDSYFEEDTDQDYEENLDLD